MFYETLRLGKCPGASTSHVAHSTSCITHHASKKTKTFINLIKNQKHCPKLIVKWFNLFNLFFSYLATLKNTYLAKIMFCQFFKDGPSYQKKENIYTYRITT